MQYAIMRIRKRSIGSAGAMARHALREDPTPNADPAKLSDNTVVAGPAVASEVVAQLKARTHPFVKRKDAVRVVELFVGASPEIMAKMSRKQQDAYFADSLRWISGKFGGGDNANIVSAIIHRDETTPHMQVLMTPIVGGKLAANKMIGGPAGLSKMQTEFAELVGAKYGMRRGEKGSRAKHTSIKSFYAAIERAGGMDALPPRVPVPKLPPEPERPSLIAGLFEGAEAKAAREAAIRLRAKAIKDRDAAIEANKVREATITELARVAIATQPTTKRLPGRLKAAEEVFKRVPAAAAIVEAASAIHREADEALQTQILERARANLDLETQVKAARPEPKAPNSGGWKPPTPGR